MLGVGFAKWFLQRRGLGQQVSALLEDFSTSVPSTLPLSRNFQDSAASSYSTVTTSCFRGERSPPISKFQVCRL